MQVLCCCCAPISSCSLAGCAGNLSHQCQHYLLLGNGAEPHTLAPGRLATCSGLPIPCPSAS